MPKCCNFLCHLQRVWDNVVLITFPLRLLFSHVSQELVVSVNSLRSCKEKTSRKMITQRKPDQQVDVFLGGVWQKWHSVHVLLHVWLSVLNGPADVFSVPLHGRVVSVGCGAVGFFPLPGLRVYTAGEPHPFKSARHTPAAPCQRPICYHLPPNATN